MLDSTTTNFKTDRSQYALAPAIELHLTLQAPNFGGRYTLNQAIETVLPILGKIGRAHV